MLVWGGGHPWHLWDHGFMGNGKEVFDLGALQYYATFCIVITGFALNRKCILKT
jgi:hypothetical protein